MWSPNTFVMDERDPQPCELIGAAIRVHNEFGCGFLEVVYREALQVEFNLSGIPHAAEADFVSTRLRPLRT